MAQIVALVIKIPSNTITKKRTQSLNVDVEYEYRGPAQRVYFTAVVTQETWYGEFDEIGSTKKVVYIDLPRSDTLSSYTTRVPNLPLSGVEPKATPYGVKIKAEGTFGTVEAGNKSCLYVKEVAVEKGTFTVYPYNPPISYAEWCVDWEVNGIRYRSSWAATGQPVTVQGPYGEDVPLGGKMYAWLWPGSGTATEYGPTPKYTLKDGGVYNYDISAVVLYTR